MNKIILIILCFFFVSCASYDINATTFRKTRSDESYDYYTFKAFADSIYEIDTERGEALRLEILKKWFDQNGLKDIEYKITQREVLQKTGKIYDIYYEVRVKK